MVAMEAENKWAAKRAKKLAKDMAKSVPPKSRKTDPNAGKGPRNPLNAKVAHNTALSGGLSKKPRCNWEMATLQEIQQFQKSVYLLIPLLSFQRLVQEAT